MRFTTFVLPFAVLQLLVGSGRAAAQSPAATLRPDWWGEADPSIGSLGLGCDVCSGRVTGGGIGLGAGVRAGARTDVGIALSGFFGSKDGTSQRQIVAGPVVRYFPSADRRWQVRGGLGWQAYRAAEGTSRLTAGALAATIGAGRRLPFGSLGELTPRVDLVVAPRTSLRQNDREIARASITTFSFGAALRFD